MKETRKGLHPLRNQRQKMNRKDFLIGLMFDEQWKPLIWHSTSTAPGGSVCLFGCMLF